MTPRHDPAPRRSPAEVARRAAERALIAEIQARMRRKECGGGRDDGAGETCPLEPNRPLDLSGGAAAALKFDG